MPTFVLSDYAFTYLGWFFTLYLTVSYIKIYDIKTRMKPIFGILLAVVVFLVCFILKRVTGNVFEDSSFPGFLFVKWFSISNLNNILQVCCTLLLFVSFKNINMKNNKFINLIASTTLAIYLFHDHPDIRKLLWIDLFKNATFVDSTYFVLYSLGAILAVFAAGVLIGLIYRYTFGLVYNKLLDVLDKKCFYKIDNIFNNKDTKESN